MGLWPGLAGLVQVNIMHAKYKVGLTFGAFSPLHYGHINLFIEAKRYCEKLIVCMSSDEYIRSHKGYEPPLDFHTRRAHLETINVIDGIDIQSRDFSKTDAIDKYDADVLFVGDDWKGNYTGEGLGPPVIYLPYTKDISSTMLREKM